LGRQEDQDRALRLSALQAAQGEYSAERAAARAAAGRERSLGSLYDIYDREGNLVQQGVPIANRDEYDALIASVGEGARIEPFKAEASAETPNLITFEIPGADGAPPTTETVDKVSPAGQARILELLEIPGARPVSVTGARTTPLFENVQAITDYAYGAANADAVAAMQNALANPPTSVDPTTGQTIMGNIPNFLIEAEARRVIRGDSTQLDPEDPRVLRAIQAIRREEAQSEENAQALVNGVAQNVIGQIALIGDPPPDIEDPDYVLRLQQNAENAFGTLSAAKSVFNTFLGVFTLNPPAPVAQQAINDVRGLNAATDVAYRRMVEGKVAQEAVNRFVSTLPNPASTLTSPQEAVSQIRSIIGFLQSGRAIAEASLASRTLSQSDAQELRTAIISSEMSIRGYQAIIDGIEGRRWTSREIEEELRSNDTERQRRIDELRRMGNSAPPPPGGAVPSYAPTSGRAAVRNRLTGGN
jgi:hypothetical protein